MIGLPEWLVGKPKKKERVEDKPVLRPIQEPDVWMVEYVKRVNEEKEKNTELVTSFFKDNKEIFLKATKEKDFKEVLMWLFQYKLLVRPMQHPSCPIEEIENIDKWVRQIVNKEFGEGFQKLDLQDKTQKLIGKYFDYGSWDEDDMEFIRTGRGKALRINRDQEVLKAPPGSVHIDESIPEFPLIDVELVKGRPLVTHLPELKLTRYVFGEGDKIAVEIILADEVRELSKKVGWWKARELLENGIKEITSDPFGGKSIDPHTSDNIARKRRIISQIDDELEQMLGLKVAIKGNGIGLEPGGRIYSEPGVYSEREDLRRQFGQMRFLQNRFAEVFTPEELETLRACPVYGYIRYPVDGPEKYQEWILMDRVVDAKQLEERLVTAHGYYRRGSTFPVFDTDKHPRLAKFADVGDFNQLYWYLARRLSRGDQDMSGHIGDIRGRNILVSGDKGKETYTIIDPL